MLGLRAWLGRWVPKKRDSRSRSPVKLKRWWFDYAAVGWLMGGLGLGALIGILSVIPAVSSGPAALFNYAFLALGLANLVANWLLIRRTPIAVPADAQPGPLGSCLRCGAALLPRTHHCCLCKVCVLGHDHHCFFAGRCIGYANQRYFIAFTAWVGLGLSYSLALFLAFARTEAAGLGVGWLDFVLIPVTVAKAVLGFVSPYDLVIVLLFHSGCVGAVAGWVLAGSQLRLLAQGLTSWEAKSGTPPPPWATRNSRGTWRRIGAAFGAELAWPLQLLAPFGPLWAPLKPYPPIDGPGEVKLC